MIRLRYIAMLAALSFMANSALAHDLERTQVSITFAGDGSFIVDVANDPNWLLLRLDRFASEPARAGVGRDARLRELEPAFIDRIVLFVDSHEIRPDTARYLPPRQQLPSDNLAPLATYRLRGRMSPGARSLRWYYGLVIDPYPLTIRRVDGRTITEWVQGNAWSDTLDLTNQFRPVSGIDVALEYLKLGYTHILPKGTDHILFVLGLFLLTMRIRPILMQVTTFTIAHSITLGLSMYGFVSLPSRVVEPLIALSIAYVAVENLITHELKPWRLALVFSFGLLHGMGFAGVLKELGLPRSEFLTALLTFNLGVEGGQLTVIAIACLCVMWFRRQDWYHQRIVMPASMVIATIGVYWTIARVVS